MLLVVSMIFCIVLGIILIIQDVFFGNILLFAGCILLALGLVNLNKKTKHDFGKYANQFDDVQSDPPATTQEPSGNLSFMAENIATLYVAIKNCPYGKTLSGQKLFYVTALADAILYVFDGRITPLRIFELTSNLNEPYYRSTLFLRDWSWAQKDPYDDLANLAIRMEIEIFHAEIPEFQATLDEICDTVIEERYGIRNVVKTVVNQQQYGRLYHNVSENMRIFFCDDDIRELIDLFDSFVGYQESRQHILDALQDR